jgi:imidazole glycerol-phosphate synthase subunit HisH
LSPGAARRETAVLDYEAGNLKSVENALTRLGAPYVVTSDPGVVLQASRLIFPGDGEAAATMSVLRRTGLDEALRRFHESGRPMLGICIGCQVIFDSSEERDTPCLGLMEGTVRRFASRPGVKVPHMGWNQVDFRDHPVARGIPPGSSFYFVHSYYPVPTSAGDVCGQTEYGGTAFPSAVAHENLVAFQFHPEKSGEVGISLLAGFLAWEG